MDVAGPSNDGEPDEFEQIARLYRPLTGGSPEALDLLDDVAVLPSRPGFDLVLTTDAMVAGVHFLADEPLSLVARKLLRANLSDLAAKGADPHGYLLTVAWPGEVAFNDRARFAAGLALDQTHFGVRLLGGDTVSTAGPLSASLTMLGWTPAGKLVRRAGAHAGDILVVSGTIGDAGLGLAVLTDGLPGLGDSERTALVERHRLPTPRLALRSALRNHANAAADVSDGLLADACHVAEASGLGLTVWLERAPVSAEAAAWLALQPDPVAARMTLVTSGDDYEVVGAVAPDRLAAFTAAAAESGVAITAIGELRKLPGLALTFHGAPLAVDRRGWMHV